MIWLIIYDITKKFEKRKDFNSYSYKIFIKKSYKCSKS